MKDVSRLKDEIDDLKLYLRYSLWFWCCLQAFTCVDNTKSNPSNFLYEHTHLCFSLQKHMSQERSIKSKYQDKLDGMKEEIHKRERDIAGLAQELEGCIQERNRAIKERNNALAQLSEVADECDRCISHSLNTHHWVKCLCVCVCARVHAHKSKSSLSLSHALSSPFLLPHMS